MIVLWVLVELRAKSTENARIPTKNFKKELCTGVMGMPMGPLGIFILAFLLYITHGIYLGGFIRAFKRCFGEITGYWIAMSIFTLIFAALITIVYPSLYFVRWSFPADYFLIFLSLSVLTFVPVIFGLKKPASPEANGNEEVEFVKSMSFKQAALLQIISAALPEELVFRYIFLGLLALWNPLAGLVAISLFFGLAHKFAHPERKWMVLLSNTLTGFVLGLTYIYTKSLLVVMAIHWLDNMIPWAYMKYENRRRVTVGTTVLLAFLPLVLLRGKLSPILEYLGGIYSGEGIVWGIGITLVMLGVVYLGLKLLGAKEK